jgi:predicted transcriptional regulator
MTDQGNRAGRTVRPTRDGLGKVLGELEAEVMEIVWTSPDSVTARDIETRVGDRRDVQYITLVTVLNNLARKGVLSREKAGKAYKFRPVLTRDAFLQKITREVMAGIMGLGPELAVNSFVDLLQDEAPEELSRLKRLLTERQAREAGE